MDDIITTDMSNDIMINQSPIDQETTTFKSSVYTTVAFTTKKIPLHTKLIPITFRPQLPSNSPKPVVRITATTIKIPSSTQNSKTSKPTVIRKLFTRPVIYIQHPPTTPEIIRKVIRTTTLKQPTPPPLTRLIYPRQTTVSYKPVYPIFKPVHPYKEVEQDFEEVTVPKNNDEALFITSPFPEYDYSKEDFDDQYNFDSPGFQNFNETNKLFSQRSEEAPNYNVVLLVISLTGLVILASAIVIFVVIRRYRRPGRINFSANGDSQSDVRYLTGDETLNFSLDNDLYGEVK